MRPGSRGATRDGAGCRTGAAVVWVAALSAPALGQCEPEWIAQGWSFGLAAEGRSAAVRDPDGAGPQGAWLVVGGDFHWVDGRPIDAIAAWDGVGWRPLGVHDFVSVSAVAVYEGGRVARGRARTDGGGTAPRPARWDGAAWHDLGMPAGGGSFDTGLAVGGSDLFVGAGLVVHYWNGSEWATLPPPPLVNAREAIVHEGALYATGAFTSVGTASANHIARWDPAGHRARLGEGLSGAGRALASFRGDLIVGGSFTQAGSVAANRIARWDGSSWHAMGVGVEAPVLDLMVRGGELLVRGEFTLAGAEPSGFLARWACPCWANCNNDADPGSGGALLSAADFACFRAAFLGQDPYADCDGDGNLTIADFACFRQRFLQGCP